MIGEFVAAFLLPILSFICFPIVAGALALNLLPLNNHENIAYWIGIFLVQIWWLSILARSHSKEKG